MAGILPNNFPVPGEPSLITYQFSEVSSGTGINTFYAFATEVTAGTKAHHLSLNPIYSDPKFSGGSTGISTDTDYHLAATTTFNLTDFIYTVRIQGRVFFHCSFGVANSAAVNTTGYLVITLYHVDNTDTATSLGSVTSNTSTGDPAKKTVILPLDVTEKKFVKGENLRVKVEMYAKSDTLGGTGHIYLAHDPLNADVTGSEGVTWTAATNPTHFKAAVPFKIEI